MKFFFTIVTLVAIYGVIDMLVQIKKQDKKH